MNFPANYSLLNLIMSSTNFFLRSNCIVDGFMILGVNLPWTLSCVRNYIVVPDTPQTRIFCIVYDTLVSKPFFRNHVLLMVFSINGFINNYWFTLMLMDIMNNSKVLGDVSRSVTDNIVALGWVFYLFIVTVVIYAQFGLEFFEDYFLYDGDTDDADERGCQLGLFSTYGHCRSQDIWSERWGNIRVDNMMESYARLHQEHILVI